MPALADALIVAWYVIDRALKGEHTVDNLLMAML
jgi:hypothetical protein